MTLLKHGVVTEKHPDKTCSSKGSGTLSKNKVPIPKAHSRHIYDYKWLRFLVFPGGFPDPLACCIRLNVGNVSLTYIQGGF